MEVSKDVQVPYQSIMTASGHPVDVQGTSGGGPEDSRNGRPF